MNMKIFNSYTVTATSEKTAIDLQKIRKIKTSKFIEKISREFSIAQLSMDRRHSCNNKLLRSLLMTNSKYVISSRVSGN